MWVSGCQRSTTIDGGVSGQNKVGTPGPHIASRTTTMFLSWTDSKVVKRVNSNEPPVIVYSINRKKKAAKSGTSPYFLVSGSLWEKYGSCIFVRLTTNSEFWHKRSDKTKLQYQTPSWYLILVRAIICSRKFRANMRCAVLPIDGRLTTAMKCSYR